MPKTCPLAYQAACRQPQEALQALGLNRHSNPATVLAVLRRHATAYGATVQHVSDPPVQAVLQVLRGNTQQDLPNWVYQAIVHTGTTA